MYCSLCMYREEVDARGEEIHVTIVVFIKYPSAIAIITCITKQL